MTEPAWPKPNRTLLAPAKRLEPGFDVSLLKHPSGRRLHSESFKRAAEIVALHCDESDDIRDEMLYPIFYLFRHYLELRLKEIVRFGVWLNILNEDDRLKLVLKSHELYALWNYARKVIVEIFPNDSKDTLSAAESHIAQIHEIDPGGEVFRYRNGKGKFDRLPDSIGLAHLRETMAALSNFLEGCHDGVSEAWQRVSEMMHDS